MAEERTCGGCTACCKTHGVKELSKPGGAWCEHCDVGQGCKIYSERPNSCQQYKCAWLVGIGLEEYRPDKTGIVPDFKSLPDIGLAVWFFEAKEGKLDSDFSKRQLRLNLEAGNCVMCVPLVGAPQLYVPAGRLNYPKALRLEGREVDIILSVLEW